MNPLGWRLCIYSGEKKLFSVAHFLFLRGSAGILVLRAASAVRRQEMDTR